MKAFRLTLKVKPGRIYVSEMGSYGPRDILIFEDVYESVAEREAYWEKFFSTPEFSAWWGEWFNEVAESGGSMEVWNLIEVKH